jgi:hypothetical protein
VDIPAAATLANTYFFLTDETNLQVSRRAVFFIYGGLFVSHAQLPQLHSLVEQIRTQYGFQPRDEFKFSPSSRPAHVDYNGFRKAKSEILEGCSSLGLRFCACLTLHAIAQNRRREQLIAWGAKTVIGAFNRFLTEEGATGVVIVDRFPFASGYQYLRDKFQVGLDFPNGSSRRLDGYFYSHPPAKVHHIPLQPLTSSWAHSATALTNGRRPSRPRRCSRSSHQ